MEKYVNTTKKNMVFTTEEDLKKGSTVKQSNPFEISLYKILNSF